MGVGEQVASRPLARVGEEFWQLWAHAGTDAAFDYLYRTSCACGHVHAADIARNERWTTPTEWGELQITVNVAKPEKDPRDIAALAAARSREACDLCLPDGASEDGSLSRVYVPLELGGEPWVLQCSPYGYCGGHSVAINCCHTPMRIGRATFERLLEFVQKFPGYFAGSNADLPGVGGSILGHDHYQAGCHSFPMDSAPVAREFAIAGFPDVRAGVLKWPATVLRLRCEDAGRLAAAAAVVLDAWRGFSAPEVGVLAFAGGVPHNTLTPIARREAGGNVLDLALRCNIASEEHPLGVFHPHGHLHHIKRENIGLIEVMGLAILPGRLQRELEAVACELERGPVGLIERLATDPLTFLHATWALDIAGRHPTLEGDALRTTIRGEVGLVFAQVLEDIGVFSWDDTGRAALDRFLVLLDAGNLG